MQREDGGLLAFRRSRYDVHKTRSVLREKNDYGGEGRQIQEELKM